MDDNDTLLFQNSIKYLHNISTLSELNFPTWKSFICLKRRLMELRKSTFLPTSATKPNLHCQRCFLNLFDSPTNYKVESKVKKYKFAKKMIRKQRNGLPLTKYQEEYLKKSNKLNGNQLVVTCGFCENGMHIKMDRPKQNQPKKLTNMSTKKKKKKNKKDKFCGLDQSIVLAMSENSMKNISEPEVICLDSETEQTPRMKMKKKQNPLKTSTPIIDLITPISKKKKENRGKLSEILQKSAKKTKKSSNLMQFLQGL